MQTQLTVFCLLTFLIFSCSKDDPIECRPYNTEGIVDWDYPTETGSFWVYEWFSLDSNGVETPMNNIDTVRIVGDSIVAGNTFAVYEEQFFGNSYNTILRRDSSGFIINHLGQQDYSYVEFEEEYEPGTLNTGGLETLFLYNVMKDTRDSIISVPAGDFSAVDREIHFYYEGNPVLNPCGDTEFVDHRFHVPGIGEVKSTSYFVIEFQTNCSTIERRLVEYFIPEG